MKKLLLVSMLGAVLSVAAAPDVPRSFANVVENYLRSHQVAGLETYADFCRLVASPAKTQPIDATPSAEQKARKVRVWGALEHLALFKEMGLDADELDPDAMARGDLPDVIFSTMAPGLCKGDREMFLSAAAAGVHVVTLLNTDKWCEALANMGYFTYQGVLTAPGPSRNGVLFGNCPRLLRGFPEGRLDGAFSFVGTSRHGMYLSGATCLMGVADADNCQIATSVAQYKIGKGAITFFGPCLTNLKDPGCRKMLLNLVDLMPRPESESFDVLLYTRWKWHRDPKTGAVAPKGSFHHMSTEVGAGHMAAYFAAKGRKVKVTDDPDVFLTDAFKRCPITVFACANEEQFENDFQRNAFYAWAKKGGGSLVLHSASNNDIGRDDWRDFLGGTFLFHYPKHFPIPFAGCADRTHPAIACLPADYVWADEEIYVNQLVPGAVKPVLTFRADKMPAAMQSWLKKRGVSSDNGVHVMEWTKPYGQGKVYYSALGHNPGDFAKPEFLEHLYQAALWTAAK